MSYNERRYVVANLFPQLHHGPGSVNLLHHGDPNFASSDDYANVCPASKYICYDSYNDSAGFYRRPDIIHDDPG
jgi:hypothetical protein